jgi:hypothetical protein
LRYQLETVPGVVEVASIRGFVRQHHRSGLIRGLSLDRGVKSNSRSPGKVLGMDTRNFTRKRLFEVPPKN